MNNDIDILEEALDLQVASRQMDLAEMGYNDAVEQEVNKQRELHELKPPSWWAKTFNTDGELRHREEQVALTMSLQTAQRRKSTFSVWQVALAPSQKKFKTEGYEKILNELKKVYKGIKAKSPSSVRQQAFSSELQQRTALLNAYSSRDDAATFKTLQLKGCSVSQQLYETAKQIDSMEKPSIVGRLLQTPSYKKQVSTKQKLELQREKLKEQYTDIKKEREPLREKAYQYAAYQQTHIQLLEPLHPDLNSNAPSPKVNTPTVKNEPHMLGQSDPTGLGLDAENIQHVRQQNRRRPSSPSLNVDDHPFAIKIPNQPPPFKKAL